MRGSQGLKSTDAARNAPPLQRGALAGWQGLSDRKAGETQLLSFPQREIFRPAPQPAVGAGPQRHPTLAANDVAAPRRHGCYNWDGRYIAQPVPDGERRSVARRVLFPAGALALLAGVAFGAFYLMHAFATGPQAAVAEAAAPQVKAETPVAAVTGTASASDAPKTDAAASPHGKAGVGQVAAVPVKTAAIAPNGAGAAGVKVPAPDNARWGEATGAATASVSQAQAAEADAAPKVDDPQSAPIPTQAPNAEASKKLAYAPSSQASAPLVDKAPVDKAPVDKGVTAALPPAGTSPQNSAPQNSAPRNSTPQNSSKETALPGVDTNPLSVPAKTSAGQADDISGGYVSTVHTAVKLHAGPSNGSRSIGVVPGKATVHVLSCQGWCKVSYEGKEGYIFKNFLGRAPAPALAAPEKAAAAPAAQAPQAPQAAAKPAAIAPADAKALEAAAERTMMRR